MPARGDGGQGTALRDGSAFRCSLHHRVRACVRACVAVGANALPMKYVMELEPAA
jgi:hypothetical protein